MGSGSTIYSVFPDGKMREILPPGGLDNPEDTVFIRPLSSESSKLVEALWGKGMSDSEIFTVRHPPSAVPDRSGPTLSIEMDMLSDEFLKILLETVLEVEAPSLARMDRPDLLALAKSIVKMLHVRLVVESK